jgi:hypothetical protein
LRGKKEPWRLFRAFLFTSYWSVLLLFVLTGHAEKVWLGIVLLLLINSLCSSAMASGKLKQKQVVLLFVVLLVMISALVLGALMLYNFITYPK